MRFINTISIDRLATDVFAFLAHFENLPLWNPAISQTRRITGGQVAVGSRYVQVRTAPRPSEETFEVTEFQPDRRLSVRGTFGPFPGESTYVLDSVGDTTLLTNTVDVKPKGLLGVLAPLAARRVKAAVAGNLDILKRILEDRDE